MADSKRSALEAEAALARFALDNNLSSSDERTINQALEIIRIVATKGYY